MVDVVANHMGPSGNDFSANYPFNKEEHYHDECYFTQFEYYGLNLDKITNCRLAILPDLK